MQSKVTIEKKLILHFALPGYTGVSSSCWSPPNGFSGEHSKQLERIGEQWRIEVDLENAPETLRALRELTTAIEVELSKGALRP